VFHCTPKLRSHIYLFGCLLFFSFFSEDSLTLSFALNFFGLKTFCLLFHIIQFVATMSAAPPGFENLANNSSKGSMTFENFDAEEVVPLENSWCFWHDKFIGPSVSVAEYEASLHKLCTFSTVQDFWKCFNNLPPVDKLRPKSSFHLMKDGISPLWEDPKNANGGFWAMRVRKQETTYVWKELVLALIGEQFEMPEGDELCGLTVSIRQADDIIRLWNTNAEAKSPTLLTQLKRFIPEADIRSPFYKANREHSAFNQDFSEKKKEGKE
jgi:hypothetical protein